MAQRLPYWRKAVWHHGPVRPPRGRRLGSIAGVPIYGRLSALVLPAMWLPLLVPAALLGAQFVAIILMIMTALVSAVVLHEAAHAIAARRAGQRVNYVVFALGGCVEWGAEGEACAPRTVLATAAAGPSLNLALVLIPFALLPFISTSSLLYNALAVTRIANVIGVLNFLPFRARNPADRSQRAGTDGWIIVKAIRAARLGPTRVDMLAPALAYGAGDGRSGVLLL